MSANRRFYLNPLSAFNSPLDFLLTDIDDTMTTEGQLRPEAYSALWDLHNAGVKVVPVTGRPAGWCEMIARMWPVTAVVGENGAFYFRYHQRKMIRHFAQSSEVRAQNRQRLNRLMEKILKDVPGCAVASDQFCRVEDLAIDFCEDVDPLSKEQVKKIVELFESEGAIAKVSSIHVNGWYGNHDKLTQSLGFFKAEFGLDQNQVLATSGFVGDSPNDEPMWKYFKHSFGVANVRNFESQIKCLPKYVSNSPGGLGFAEIAHAIIKSLKT